MTHLQTCLANEAAALSAKALAHRIAAKSGVEVLAYGGHSYKGDANWHNSCAENLERQAAQLNTQLTAALAEWPTLATAGGE